MKELKKEDGNVREDLFEKAGIKFKETFDDAEEKRKKLIAKGKEAKSLKETAYDSLYCMMSALQSRVNRKIELKWDSNSIKQFNEKFDKLIKIISDELDCCCRDQIASCIDKNNSSKLFKHTVGTRITNQDFFRKLKSFVGQH